MSLNILSSDKNTIFRSALSSLKSIGPVSIGQELDILSPIYLNDSRKSELRFLAHYLSDGAPDSKIVLEWLGEPWRKSPEMRPQLPNRTEGAKVLTALMKVWGIGMGNYKLRSDLASQMAHIVKVGSFGIVKEIANWTSFFSATKQNSEKGIWNWETDDLAMLNKLSAALKGRNEMDTVNAVILSMKSIDKVRWALKGLAGQMVFWAFLIFVYPFSRMVQAIFFWNPWVRKIIGLGYVGFLLTWFPPFRWILFYPFRGSLLSDAQLSDMERQDFFEDMEVKRLSSNKIFPLWSVLSPFKGQAILEGESGLGKSMFLKKMARDSRRIIAYLPAEKCSAGVMRAIQEKLGKRKGDTESSNKNKGFQINDPKFLTKLIYAGALDVCIDGLNEVSPATLAIVTNFMTDFSGSNILAATQPLNWDPPGDAVRYRLLPLSKEKIESFLFKQKSILKEEDAITAEEYEAACKKYVKEFETKTQQSFLTDEEQEKLWNLLSNPLDLSLIARLLAKKQNPQLNSLIEQNYKMAADDHQDRNQSSFPIKIFCEEAYQQRCKDQNYIAKSELQTAVESLARKKMMIIHEGTRKFRHDKIMEHFIVQTFFTEGQDNPRLTRHWNDAKFRGVYILLAGALEEEQAKNLERALHQNAVKTKDRTISDPFFEVIQSRFMDSEKYAAIRGKL